MKDAASPLGSRRWPAQTHTGCVWLPQLQLRAEILRHPAWDGRPVVMSGGPRERKTVQLCSPEAELAGLRPGLPLREVLPLCPDALVLQPDPVRTAAVLEDVLRQLQLVTPRVEMSRPLWVSPGKRAALGVFAGQEMAFLDLRGSEQVYEHSFDALEQAIHAAVPWLLQPRLGLAGGKFAAAVAAQPRAPGAGRWFRPWRRRRSWIRCPYASCRLPAKPSNGWSCLACIPSASLGHSPSLQSRPNSAAPERSPGGWPTARTASPSRPSLTFQRSEPRCAATIHRAASRPSWQRWISSYREPSASRPCADARPDRSGCERCWPTGAHGSDRSPSKSRSPAKTPCGGRCGAS